MVSPSFRRSRSMQPFPTVHSHRLQSVSTHFLSSAFVSTFALRPLHLRNALSQNYCKTNVFTRLQISRPGPRPRHIITALARDLPLPLAPVVSTTWELDFYSRPVVGFDGKKLWELIITDSQASFEHVEAIPNSLVNSTELRNRVNAVIDAAATKPTTIRFFRSQMVNMITIALSDVDAQIAPSRKTYALFKLLAYREQSVYTAMPGFNTSLMRKTTFNPLDFKLPRPLPDELRCDSFAFGNFPLAQLVSFFEKADSDDYFGDSCLVDGSLAQNIAIPGLILFSKRANPLSAWISGTELAFINVLFEKQQIVLECGLNTAYRFAEITADLKKDAKAFQNGKDKTEDGIHFLAVQEDKDSDEVHGMWLLSNAPV